MASSGIATTEFGQRGGPPHVSTGGGLHVPARHALEP